jgi:NADPH:quinone reductase-like Zn-dependent oxidoreductase
MKAVVFEKQGLENLQIVYAVKKPKVNNHDVLIKTTIAIVNLIDYTTVTTEIGVKPFPHIPCAETASIIKLENM